MSTEYNLQTPLNEDRVRKLKLGDMVYISGEIVITAGLPTHQRIMQYINQGKNLPVDLENAAFFHLGSYIREQNGNFEIVYLNPTTSTRFNPYMDTIIQKFKLKAVGGKGGLDLKSVEAMKDVGCVYLSFLGGGCPILSPSVRDILTVGWSDLVSHYRLVHLKVEKLGPAVVTIDAHGNSIYERIAINMIKIKSDILEQLAKSR